MKKNLCGILIMLLISGCSSNQSENVLKDSKTIVLGTDNRRKLKAPDALKIFNNTEIKFLDKNGNLLGSKNYHENYYKVKVDKNYYYLVSSEKIIKGSLTDQTEEAYNFDPQLNAIDSKIYLYEGNLYSIDNQGFRPEPMNYLTSIYKNNEKQFDIIDDQATSLVVVDQYIYVLTENNHNRKEPERGIVRNIYRYNTENQQIDKMEHSIDSSHYSSTLITDAGKLYLYLYMADNVPTPDNTENLEDRLIVLDKNMEIESVSEYERFGPSFISDIQNHIINNTLYIKSERHELRAINLSTLENKDVKLDEISNAAQYHYWSQHWYESDSERLVVLGNYESNPYYSMYVYDLKTGHLIEEIKCPDVSALFVSSSN